MNQRKNGVYCLVGPFPLRNFAEAQPHPVGKRWAIHLALQEMRRIQPIFARHYWTVALYGSTLWYGEGRDLDIMVATISFSPKPPSEVLHAAFPDTDLGNLYKGLMDRVAYAFMYEDRIYDIQFQLPPPNSQ
jgi:hypothetical protein